METNATILVKGVKQRFYFGDTVYLPNNTEFEIEFFNKSTRTVCPSITINGEKLTSSPVVHNGQKYVLTDFIDIPRKLLFKVYEVDINDKDVQNAIKFNGIISIKYYYEKIIIVDIENGVQNVTILPFRETGKIMKGSLSDKRYNKVNIDLDYTTYETQIIKLLPLSRKPTTFQCPKCKSTSSSEANYCANCGNSFI